LQKKCFILFSSSQELQNISTPFNQLSIQELIMKLFSGKSADLKIAEVQTFEKRNVDPLLFSEGFYQLR